MTIRHTISENAESVLRDPFTLFLAGLGITLHPYEYLGGMLLALAGASLASAMNHDMDRKSFWIVMLAAFFVSHLAAIVTYHYFPDISVQFVMAVAGFGSRYATRLALKIFGVIETRSDKIADRIVDRVIPGRQGDMAQMDDQEPPR